MDDLNYNFLNEFKRLEKLCNDIYGKIHGVTLYIDDMEAVPRYEYYNIFNWETDLKQLKRIRYLRNQIVHSDDLFDKAIVTQNDIYFVREFYNRILNQSDPLSCYRKSKEAIKKTYYDSLKKDNLTNCNIPNSNTNNAPNAPKRSKSLLLKLLTAGVLLVVFVVVGAIIIEHIYH